MRLKHPDVLEKAKSLGIDVTSHLSNVTDEQATEIRNAYSKNNKNNVVMIEIFFNINLPYYLNTL